VRLVLRLGQNSKKRNESKLLSLFLNALLIMESNLHVLQKNWGLWGFFLFLWGFFISVNKYISISTVG